MNTDKKSTFAPQSNKNATEQEKAPILHVQTGLKAGAQDDVYGNDAARGLGAAKGAVDFLANWFS